jgi:hypothetical protein
MKYRVKKGRTISYPDGSIRGQRGYIVDGSAYYERPTLEDYADSLEPAERQAVPSPVDVGRLWSVPEPEPEPEPAPAPKVAKKKASKKKAAKKATVEAPEEDQ